MPLSIVTTSSGSNPLDFHDRLDEDSQNMHNPKGLRSAEAGYELRKGADGEVEYVLTTLPAALSFDSGATAPSTEVAGDIYILSSSFKDLTTSDIEWQSGTTVRYTFSGSPDLSAVTTSDYLVHSTATNDSNNGRFVITTVNDGSDYIEVTNANRTDATDDETTVSLATEISYRDWDGAIEDEWVKYNSVDGEWQRVVPVEGVTCYIKDEDVIYSFDGSAWNSLSGVGTQFFKADTNSSNGSHRVRTITSSGAWRFEFKIPTDYSSLNSLVLIGIISAGADGSGKGIDWTSEYGGTGEDKAIHTESDTVQTFDLTGTTDQFYSFDISGVFTSISAGDNCGLLVNHGGIGGDIDYIGVYIAYNK